MKSIVPFFLGLIFGAAGGAYVAKVISDKKTGDAIEKATLEARDYYKEKFDKKEESKPESNPEPVVENFTRIYGKAFDIRPQKPMPGSDVETYAYEIDPDEFGEDSEYTTYSLDYYSDGNLVDETGNVVDDPVHLVGGDVLDSISMENPTAYVRNDITKTDYEISYVDDIYDQPGGLKD